MTHFVPYTKENLGKDHVVTACGKLVPVTDFSPHPDCPQCKVPARLHAIKVRLSDKRAGIIR